MFQGSLRLPFKLLGIPVKLDWSFLLILPFLAWLIGSQITAYVLLINTIFGLELSATALQRGPLPYFLGLVAAIGLFISVVIHELGHAVTARRYGVKTQEITLWFLGGLAQFDDMPKQRGAEAIVAIAGPITSVLLAAVLYLLWLALPAAGAATQFVISYLLITNAMLALFNLLPAIPLDGGRVLRSLLALRLPYLEATRLAANIGQVVAILLGIYGFLTFQIFLLIIAFFIYSAGRSEAQYAVISEILRGIKVRDLMSSEVVSVSSDMPISQLFELMFFKKHLGYPVVDDDRLLGFVKLQDAKDAGEDSVVADIMSRQLDTIYESEDALEALKRVAETKHGRFVVLTKQGDIVGILSKTDLLRAVQLGIDSGGKSLPGSKQGGQGNSF